MSYKCAAPVFLLLLVLVHSEENVTKGLKSHPNWKLLDRDDDCGFSTTNRIIGGEKAFLGQYPWIARLGYSMELDPDDLTPDVYQCGGVIISERYILTAAHCQPKVQQLKLVQVRLGEHDTDTDTDCVDGVCAPPTQDLEVEDYVCHPKFKIKTFHNDICLVRVAKPIQFNRYVSPICLPVFTRFENLKNDGKMMEVAGWGVTNINTQDTSNTLLTLKVPVIPFKDCVKAFEGKSTIIETQMCAGGVVGKDSCNGDSGGPLMRPYAINGPPRFFVVGIVSFGLTKCASSTTPGVYTEVASFLKWILDRIRE